MSLDTLLRKLASKDNEERRVAAERLGELGHARAISALIHASGRGGGEMAKHAAVRALTTIGRPALPFLIDTLANDMESVFRRASAAEALGLIGENRAVKPLLKSLKDDNSMDVRLHSVVALARLRDERAVPYLVGALLDESGGVRVQAATALGLFRSRKAVGPLIKALQDEKWYVRQHSARSLGLIGDKRSVGPLRSRLRDGRPAVARAAKESLARLSRNV